MYECQKSVTTKHSDITNTFQSSASPIPFQKPPTESPMDEQGGHGYSNPMSGPNGDQTSSAMAKAKLDSFKNWSISTYKCTRQMVQVSLRVVFVTVDQGSGPNKDRTRSHHPKLEQ